jgi:hypothetical protein
VGHAWCAGRAVQVLKLFVPWVFSIEITLYAPPIPSRSVLAVLDNQKLSFYEGEEGAAANAEPVLRITLTSELVVTRELPESGAKQSLRVRSSAGEVYLVGEEDGVDWNTHLQVRAMSYLNASRCHCRRTASVKSTATSRWSPPVHLQEAIDGLAAKATEGRASTAPTVPTATAGGERGEKAPGVGARAGSARGVGPAQPQPQAQAAASKATPWGETGAKIGGMSKKDSEMSAAEQALTAASVGGGSSVRAPEPVGRVGGRVVWSHVSSATVVCCVPWPQAADVVSLVALSSTG